MTDAAERRELRNAGATGGGQTTGGDNRTESDIVYERMNEQERARAWEIFNAASSGQMTPDEVAREVRRNERRVRQSMSQQCGPGERWDEETQSCVLIDPTAARQDALIQMQQQMMAEQKKQAQESARTIISGLLADYGLESLGDWIWGQIQQGDITNPDALVQLIRKRPEYAARFPGMAQRAKAGFNAISEGDYIRLERTYRQTLRAAGLPTDFYNDPTDFGTLIGGDVSPAELDARITEGYQAVAQASPTVRSEMRRLYGVDDGALAAYFLDPERATPILLRQARAAEIGAQAQEQAQQQITAQQAEQLAVAGVTAEQARAGFQTIAQAQELFVSLPGTTETGMTQEEQIAGVFATSAAAQQRIRQRQRERTATFEVGGGFAGQGTTVTGLQ